VTPLELTLACASNDRTRALEDGRVQPEGMALRCIGLSPEETFFRMVRHREFDVAELSLSTYVLTLEDGAPFVAIPVFPSRAFRHNGIYVNSASDVKEPADLVGGTVGVAEYQLTANVWIRGILAEFHSVPVGAVRYMTGGLHEPGRVEKVELPGLPAGVEVVMSPPGRTLAGMLVDGEIDAIYTPRTPQPFLDGDSRVRRLFPDVRAVEERYFELTGIFPIMHVVVVRHEVYQAHRWVAGSLLKAFTQSRDLALADLDETATLPLILPWIYEDIARVRSVMGSAFWSYGMNPGNELSLRTFLRYSAEQGLASRQLEPADLFAPETLDTVVV